MGLPLRLTYGEQDISFEILDNKPFNYGNGIVVAFNGQTYQLYRPASEWMLKEGGDPLDNELASAIGKAISLRYRI